MNEQESTRLAAAINSLRPDWPSPSLVTFIRKDLGRRAYRDAALALVWVALDEQTKTPARVLEAGPWWGTTRVGASDADRHPSSIPIGELCAHHGTHRDTCACNGPTIPAPWRNEHERQTRIERNSHGAATARDVLKAARIRDNPQENP